MMKSLAVAVFVWILCLNAYAGKAGLPMATGHPHAGFALTYPVALPDGEFIGWNNVTRQLLRFHADGSIVASSGDALGPSTLVGAVAFDSLTGTVWVGGVLDVKDEAGAPIRTSLAKFTTALRIDQSLTPILASYSQAHSFHVPISRIVSDNNGGVYIAGAFDRIADSTAQGLVHVSSRGSLSALVAPPGTVGAMAVGKLGLLIATQTGLYLHSGTTFSPLPNQPTRVSVNTFTYHRDHGLAVIVQYGNESAVIKVLDDAGIPVPSFDGKIPLGFPPHSMAWDDRGRLLICGTTAVYPNDNYVDPSFSILRLTARGTLDPAWSRAVAFDLPPSRLIVLSNGDYLAFGAFQKINGVPRPWSVRLSCEETAKRSLSVNSSCRGFVQGGSRRMILGFVLDGETWTEVLIRGIGPSLKQFAVLETPTRTNIRLFAGQNVLQEDTMGSPHRTSPMVRDATLRSGAFATVAAQDEGQISTSLPPGAYTVLIEAPSGESGEVLGELYFP